MKFWQFLLVSISVLSICQSEHSDTTLTPFIEKSARLARVSAAIAIQNGVYDSKFIIAEVIAEFLNIRPSTIAELLKHDFNALAKGLEDYSSSLDKVSVKINDPNGLIAGLKLIMEMKEHEQFLKPGAIKDPSARFMESKDVVLNHNSEGTRMLTVENFQNALNAIEKIYSVKAEDMGHAERKKVLISLRKSLEGLKSQLPDMRDYSTKFAEFLQLDKLKDELKDYNTLVGQVVNYSNAFNQIEPHREELDEASEANNAGQMAAAIKEKQKYSETVQTLSSLSILSSNVRSHSGKHFTNGLLEYKDLNQITDDLNDLWFRRHVLENREVEPIESGLQPLKKFLSRFPVLNEQWGTFSGAIKSRESTLGLIEKIDEIFDSIEKVLEISDNFSPFKEVSECIGSMGPLNSQPDPAMLDRISSYADSLHDKIAKLKEVLPKLADENIAATIDDVDAAYSVVSRFEEDSDISEDETLKVWTDIRESDMKDKLKKPFESKLAILNSMKGLNLFYDGGDELDFAVISSISHIFEGTNVETVMNCIKQESVSNLSEMLEFIDKTQDLKSQDFKTASAYIASLSKVKSEYVKMEEAVKKTKLSNAAIRLRDAPEFKNIRKISEGLGKGVYSLRALNDVKKAEKSITVVANPDLEVKKVAALVKGIDAEYNDASREQLKTVVTKMDEFEESVAPESRKRAPNMTKFFEHAGELDFGDNMDLTFSTEISMQLASDPNPKTQAFAKDFQVVGGLDFDFVKHNFVFGEMPRHIEDFETSIREFLDSSARANFHRFLVIVITAVVTLALTAFYYFIYREGSQPDLSENLDDPLTVLQGLRFYRSFYEKMKKHKKSMKLDGILPGDVFYSFFTTCWNRACLVTPQASSLIVQEHPGSQRFPIPLHIHSRFKLLDYGNRFLDGYIHASKINYPSGLSLILTQGPMIGNMAQFWWMAKQSKTKHIVMLTMLKIDRIIFCDRYFPAEIGETMKFENTGLTVTCLTMDTDFEGEIEIRELEICFEGSDPFTVTHYQYLGWADEGVPDNLNCIYSLLSEVRTNWNPVIVHCTDGVGRSGCFAYIEYGYQLLSREMDIDFLEILDLIRSKRAGAISNAKQLAFCAYMIGFYVFKEVIHGFSNKEDQEMYDFLTTGFYDWNNAGYRTLLLKNRSKSKKVPKK